MTKNQKDRPVRKANYPSYIKEKLLELEQTVQCMAENNKLLTEKILDLIRLCISTDSGNMPDNISAEFSAKNLTPEDWENIVEDISQHYQFGSFYISYKEDLKTVFWKLAEEGILINP